MAALGGSLFSCQGIMRTSMCLMTGVAFCFGMLLGMLVRLPVVVGPGRAASLGHDMTARGLLNAGGLTHNYLVDSIVKETQFDHSEHKGLGLSVEETEASLSLNSALIPDIDNAVNHNRDQSSSHHSQHGAGLKTRELEHLQLVTGETRKKVDRPNERNAEFPQGQIHLQYEGNSDRHLHKKDFRNVKVSPSGAHSRELFEKFNKLSDIIRGIHWSEKLENLCPSGFTDDALSGWTKQVSEGKVVHLTEGCGRMQNRLLTLQDSSKACARYRPNADQIQGEIYSYHLAKILGIRNVPPTVLTMVKSVEAQWEHVNQEILMSQWVDEKLVVLTRWIDDLEPAYIPKEFQSNERNLSPKDSQLLNKTLPELCELVQWSDLIVFDYLTANLDRVVNNMFNQQWNSQMMASPAHNLEKDKTSGRLVFLDNESGLLHGYRLLDKYASYHDALLESVCIFRESTVEAVEKLFLENNIGQKLQDSFDQNEIYHEHLPKFPESNADILNQRLGRVYDKMQRCRLNVGSS